MLDTNITLNSKYNTEVNIHPACVGMMQKSHQRSFFKRFHKDSNMAEWVFSDTPCLKKRNEFNGWEKYMDVIVLQIMCFGDNEFLCELIDSKIFEE